MDHAEAQWIVGAAFAALAVGSGVYGVIRADLRTQVARMHARLDELDARQQACRQAYEDLRDELHRDYPPRQQFEELRREIKADFGETFRLLTRLQVQMARFGSRKDLAEDDA